MKQGIEGIKNSPNIQWDFVYTTSISLLGGVVLFYALESLPKDLIGLALFAAMVAVSELGSVELFHSTRNSTVSVSMIITIAAVFCLRPTAGILLQLVTALMNTFATHLLHKGPHQDQAASLLRRWAFNTGMFVLATASAGFVFLFAGGQVGNLLHLSSVLPLILAVITDTMMNVILLMGIISLQTKTPMLTIWREDIRWGVPICIIGEGIGGFALALAYQLNGLIGSAVFFVPIFAIGYSFRLYANNMRDTMDRLQEMNQELQVANQELRENTAELFETLSAVIDAYDIYTLRHSRFVTDYADAIAEKMGLSHEEKNKIIRAALVHDIGKIGISESIIGKKGGLTENEYDILKRHPSIGADILRRMKGFADLVPLVQSHQEKYDGSGYPQGLKGEAIPLGARILTLADSVEAMLSDRAYRKGFPLSYVIEEVKRCSGSHFDPQVVNAFLAVVEDRGPDFFKNSAQYVDREELLLDMGNNHSEALRFLKRSLVGPAG